MNFRKGIWCCSPNCVGKCKRKLSDADRTLAHALGEDRFMSFGYFCGYPENMTPIERVKAKFGCALERLRQR